MPLLPGKPYVKTSLTVPSPEVIGRSLNWPFVPATINVGSDEQWCSADNPDEYPAKNKMPEVTDPFTGKTCYAFNVIKPDMAAIHVTMADIYGNAIMLGTSGAVMSYLGRRRKWYSRRISSWILTASGSSRTW